MSLTRLETKSVSLSPRGTSGERAGERGHSRLLVPLLLLLGAFRSRADFAVRDGDTVKNPRLESLQAQALALEEGIVALQRDVARPVPVKFVVSPAVDRPGQPSPSRPAESQK